ncbi:chloride channel protein C-like isoform X1 [Argiope bruennichi]|uniref:chloride channel protein C-like isoform X1 n=2 Tax=Argiope bruennichi TaxID=94029 RepID=UPI002495A46C|nr:chloride channel protein C-like isoform X1 [Argiope bruennichi]
MYSSVDMVKVSKSVYIMESNSPERVEMNLSQNVRLDATGAERILQFIENVPGDYGSPLPENDNVQHNFFEKGRDLESAFVNHKYTDAEKKLLSEYESLDYLPPHSKVYKQWLHQQPARMDWDHWVMMGLIGFLVGVLGFFLHQFIELLADLKWEKAREYIEEDNFMHAWLWVIAISLLFVFISSSSVVLLRPSAAGSGLPEIIAYLNGTIVRHIFNVKTLVIKFISCVFAVSSGMPVGPEGPMIHLGSLVGAGCSQLKSSTLKINLPFFKRFRNSEDRRNFISAGAAAGVASAFGSPVGGLLFSMEEVSSFWNMKLSWQTFFCCMISTFTSDLLNSAFTGFHYEGNFGLFKTEKYILFQVVRRIDLNIIALVPTIIVGVLGGLLGTLFTFLNLKVARVRRKLLSSVKSKGVKQTLQITEPLIIMIIMGTLSVFLPTLLPCTTFACDHMDENGDCSLSSGIRVEKSVESYNCFINKTGNIPKKIMYNTSYNEAATLLYLTGDRAIHHLFSRGTHLEFNFLSLLVVLPCYFILACWAAGTSISSGVVIPKMYIGGVMGRLVGRIMVEAFGIQTDLYWAWMDPGAFALIGAAAFFGGVSRLTMSLTVIMVELTNDVQFLLLIMVAIMVSKWVGDYVTHPFYHAQLELKCIPFLDSEPVVLFDGTRNLNLELFEASHIMSSPVVTIETEVSVSQVAKLLLETNHCGFPVVKRSNNISTFFGLITRTELSVLLCHEEAFDSDSTFPLPAVDYSQFCEDDVEKLGKSTKFLDMLSNLTRDEYSERYLNLIPYVNKSAVCVRGEFSLHRAYIIFRSLGLRHLIVVNESNEVVGIITRKDLMGYNIEEKLSKIYDSFNSREMASFEEIS